MTVLWLWLVEEEKRYTTEVNQVIDDAKLWLVEEEKRYTTSCIVDSAVRKLWLVEKVE